METYFSFLEVLAYLLMFGSIGYGLLIILYFIFSLVMKMYRRFG